MIKMQYNKRTVKCNCCGRTLESGEGVKAFNNKWYCDHELMECSETCDLCHRVVPKGQKAYSYLGRFCKLCFYDGGDVETLRESYTKEYGALIDFLKTNPPLTNKQLREYFVSHKLPEVNS